MHATLFPSWPFLHAELLQVVELWAVFSRDEHDPLHKCRTPMAGTVAVPKEARGGA